MTNFLTKKLKKAYHHLFEYNTDKLCIYSQFNGIILARLSYAILHKNYILITFQDGSYEIGQILKRISIGRFVLRDIDRKILRIVDIDDIFRVDL
ncbi:hypothetical protein [Lactobacillus amylovorus]|uniref:hypothetical protein n=1 Tax=Lactobacillus amylovorus TaxID=1604 RepID=UPI0021C76A24|nr:hypothetical protein [Lactobacillus amylovorus]UXN11235.1 hypothetical protein N6G93_06420 [Lactobacillus amylovorus]